MYHYTLCGLDNIYLNNGYTIKDTPYGETVSIQDIKGLHKVIGLSIIESPNPLTPKEIKFLRKEMDWSQKALAEMLSVREITVRKWESGDNTISGTADRLLRVLYKECVDENSSIKILIEKIAQLDKKNYSNTTMQFTETANGWKKKAA